MGSFLHRLVLALALLGTGCAGPLASLTHRQPIAAGRGRLELRSATGTGADVELVRSALEQAPGGLERWGGLEEPVTVYLLPSHEALEQAVRRGYGWLRAWARYDDVLLQAPSTWTKRSEEVDALVLHELTHCLLFQRTGTRADWTSRDIPLWFREGMALWTARQGADLPSLEDTARWLVENRDLDVFGDAEGLATDFYPQVYGVAHHAFAFLARRAGVERVGRLMEAMKRGQKFEPAFREVYGLSTSAFQRDLFRYLTWRGFRGSGRAPATRDSLPRPR